MNPDLIRQLECFSLPSSQVRPFSFAPVIPLPSLVSSAADTSQTTKPVGLPSSGPTASIPSQPSASLQNSAIAANGDVAEPSLTKSRPLLVDVSTQTATPPSLSFGPPTQPSPHHDPTRRKVIPAQTPKKKEAHPKKRPKFVADAMPFDSADYWLQFHNINESTAENLAAPSLGMDSGVREKTSSQRRSPTTMRAHPSALAAPTPSKPRNTIDDYALENALSDEEDDEGSPVNLAEHSSSVDAPPPSEATLREGHYSTPLSWEQPQMGMRLDPPVGVQRRRPLSEEERRRLIATAMNMGPPIGGSVDSNIATTFDGPPVSTLGPRLPGLGIPSISQVTNIAPQPRPAASPTLSQRPIFKSIAGERAKERVKQGGRTAHNDIEKKYRTKLKDRIAELRDAVPALRSITEDASDDGMGVNQPSRGQPKVSKGTVLLKATEYIHYLERKNTSMQQQHNELTRRLQAFEQLLTAAAAAVPSSSPPSSSSSRPSSFQVPNYGRAQFDPRPYP